MSFFVGLVLRTVILGFIFWGVMYLFNRDKKWNNLPMAFLMGFCMGWGVFGLIGVGLILINYYEMGFLEMILFAVLFYAATFGVGYILQMAA